MAGPAKHTPDSTSSRFGDDGKWEHTFRQSGLNTALHGCAEQYRAQLAGEFASRGSSAAAIGTGVHASIEHDIDGMICGEDDFDGAVLAGMKAYNYEASLPGFVDEHGPRKAGDLILNAYTNWRLRIRPKLHPVGTERTFKQVLLYEDDVRRIYANGTWDYHDRKFGLIDWKTSGREKAPWEEKRWNIQSTLYTWVAELLGDLPVKPVHDFSLIVMVHGKPNIQWLTLQRDQSHRDWLLKQMLQLAHMTEANLDQWPLNDGSWLCSPKWCGKYEVCRGSFGGDHTTG
jgi:hypothetical protein